MSSFKKNVEDFFEGVVISTVLGIIVGSGVAIVFCLILYFHSLMSPIKPHKPIEKKPLKKGKFVKVPRYLFAKESCFNVDLEKVPSDCKIDS